MPVIIESERLILRTWESNDASAAFAIWGDPEVMRYVGDPFADLKTARRALEGAADAQQRHGVCLWAVIEKATDEVVGACGFHFVAEGPELELAFHFRRAHWGRNLATEAVRSCLHYATETLGAKRIIAGVEIGNAASRRVLEKTGFRFERLDRIGDVEEEWFSIPRPT